MRYEVSIYSVYSEVLEVIADSKEEALAKFRDDKGLLVDSALEYSHTITDPSEITADQVREVGDD